MNFLNRKESPLTEDQWKKIDEAVIKTARNNLVGRRFVEITPASTPYIQAVPYDIISEPTGGACVLFGDKECDVVKVKNRKFLPIPQIYKDFKFHWRDIESAKNDNQVFDVSVVATAAREISIAEDVFIFNGDSVLGYPGILNVEGKTEIKKENFDQEGNIFKTSLKCIEALTANGYSSNFALILNPKDYSKAFRLQGNSGMLEIKLITKIFDFGVFSTYAVPEGTVVAIAAGLENMDLFIAQDMTTAFLAVENMDYYFRVFELLAFRIKNPSSIVIAK